MGKLADLNIHLEPELIKKTLMPLFLAAEEKYKTPEGQFQCVGSLIAIMIGNIAIGPYEGMLTDWHAHFLNGYAKLLKDKPLTIN